MIKKVGFLVFIVCLLLSVLSPSLVQAHSSLSILDSSAQVDFPSRISFSLSVESDVDITDIRLCYTVDRVSFAQVVSEVYLGFVPATTVDISWTLEMVRVGGLPPGSSVDYWWVVKDARGDSVETAPAQVIFDDNRYSWRSLTEGKVIMYWYKGDESFADGLMAAAQQSLSQLAEDTGAHLEKPARLYIYTNAQDLKGAMIYPQEWTGGVAFTRYGVMAIGIGPSNLEWGKRAIAHELTHLVIHQMTLNPYIGLPTWLDEGLAMYNEGELGSEFKTYLNRAIANRSLISVRSLCSPFSAYAGESLLSYAQSYSLVDFLISNYGQAKMLELLNTFKQGSSYDAALEKVYGFDIDGLDALWQDYVSGQHQSSEVTTSEVHRAPVDILSVVTTAFLFPLGLTFTRRVGGRR